MRITFDPQHKIFVAASSYEEVPLLSEKRGGAGWRFHGQYCKGKALCCKAGLPANTWWTDEPVKARRLAVYADTAALEALGELVNTLKASQAQDAPAELDLPCPAGLAYLPYQRAGIAYGLEHRNVLIADAMGLGKTIQALGIVNADPAAQTVLIVCPASLRLNWKREAAKWLCTPRATVVIESGKDTIAPETQVVIVNYDLIHRAGVRDQLMARGWDALIVDEAHYCKNARGAARAKAVLGEAGKKRGDLKTPGLIDRAGRVIMLTGTPIPNGQPMEVWPILNAIAPQAFGNWIYFAKRYGGGVKKYMPWVGRAVWTWEPETCRVHLPELQQKMRSVCMVRRTKEAVLTDLAPKRYQVITLPGSVRSAGRAERIFGEAHERIALLADSTEDADHEQAIAELSSMVAARFEEIAALRADLAREKIPDVIEHLDRVLEETDPETGIAATEKVIVFAHHHAMIDALLAQYGAQAVVVDGRRSMEERQEAVDRFQTDPAVRVFIGQITAAGVGLTLTAASTVVFAELSWVPGDNTQAEDRAHRIGQTGSVLIQQLVVDGSLDATIAKLLARKAGRSNLALDAQVVDGSLPLAEVAERKAKSAEAARALAELPEEQRAAIREAVRFLAGHCDGARREDEQGFNRFDSAFGKSLAETPDEKWSAARYLAARKMLGKYKRQLGPERMAQIAGGGK